MTIDDPLFEETKQSVFFIWRIKEGLSESAAYALTCIVCYSDYFIQEMPEYARQGVQELIDKGYCILHESGYVERIKELK